MVLPLLFGTTLSGRSKPDWQMACSATSCCATKETLRAARSIVPAAATPGTLALGLRFAKNVSSLDRPIRRRGTQTCGLCATQVSELCSVLLSRRSARSRQTFPLPPLTYSAERNRTAQKFFPHREDVRIF